ncbi:MAG: cobyrinic acid a,c-diamide synthase [Ilumatobacteraceae bacterium]|nr:cobyrinic acid a,c-diamide synthase [Ilumatobacteraceae bacterium]
MIAGTNSGVGKTTVATGIMAAMRRRGTRVAPAKVGPDFIDPGYHALACGRPGRNLDAWMSGPELIPALAARAGLDAEVLVVEGVMGLFDGAADGTLSSTADIAHLIDAPVILVVDCSAQAGSVAAVVHGFATFDPRVRVAGVVLNRLASAGHESMVRDALSASTVGVPVVGALHRDERLSWRDRHLGLIPVAEQPEAIGRSLDLLAELILASCDLDAIEAIARTAEPMAVDVLLPRAQPVVCADGRRPRIAVAAGRAFTFSYPDNVEALIAAGAEIVELDPLLDPHLPEGIDGLVIGGGFPEVMVDQLAGNTTLLTDVRERIAGGLVTWAECGGLLWLAASLDGRSLAGVVHTSAVMTKRLTLGYRTAETLVPTPFGPSGVSLRGHEFHYSETTPSGEALHLTGRNGEGVAGFATPTLLASYLHVHLAARPDLAAAFVACAAGSRVVVAASGPT